MNMTSKASNKRKPETAVKKVGRLSGACMAIRRHTMPITQPNNRVKPALTIAGTSRPSRNHTRITNKVTRKIAAVRNNCCRM